MKLIIRYATVDDIPAMYAISLHAHQASYDGLIPSQNRAAFDARYTHTRENEVRYYDSMVERLKKESWELWVAEFDKIVVGYTLQERTEPHVIFKHALFVDPKWYGRGVGTALFEASLAAAIPGDTIQLAVVTGNERAKQLYKSHNFVFAGYDSKGFFGATLEVMKLTVY